MSKIQRKNWYLLLGLASIALILSVLALWGVTSQAPGLPEPVATLGATHTSLSSALSQQALEKTPSARVDQEVASGMSLTSTMVAFTPTSRPSSPPTTYTPKSTPTLAIGWVDCPQSANSISPYFRSCWRGVLDGEVIELYAGRQQSARYSEEGASYDQGILFVGHGTHSYWKDSGRFYVSPLMVGALSIQSIIGNMISLASEDANREFMFDLKKRQWVPPGAAFSHDLDTGWIPCPISANTSEPVFHWCWIGRIEGEDVRIDTGSIGSLGVVRVSSFDEAGAIYSSTVYPAPEYTGPIYPASIQDSKITVAPYDQQTKAVPFIFDIKTRQWVSPAKIPTPIGGMGSARTCTSPYATGGPYWLTSCWKGIVKGKVLSVATAFQSLPAHGRQVLLLIPGPDFDPFDAATAIHETPLKLDRDGILYIASVDDAQVILTTEDKRRTFVFDLTTRQWVNP